MKILQINSVQNKGSTGRIAEAIGLKIKENGWESYIGYGRESNPSQSKSIRIGSRLDVYAHIVVTRLTDRHGFASSSATKEFIQQVKEIKPDIIHLHNIHGYYLNVELFFKFLSQTDIPVVWTLHDCWSFTGHCSYFEYAHCEKWKVMCHHCPQTKEYPASWLDQSKSNFKDKKYLFNLVKNLTLIPVSNWLNGKLKDSFLSNYPTKVIKNGIDLSQFFPHASSELKEQLNIKESFLILGVASVWAKRKGLEEFIQFSHLLKEGELILLVGLTEEQSKHLPPNIISIRRTESIEELSAIYSAADVFLNLTLEDNYPTTNLEAIACGTPVITYKTGGSVESVDEATGFVIEQSDFSALRVKINEIKEKTKAAFGTSCRNKAIRDFDQNEKFQDYIELYKSLMYKKHENKK